MATWIAVVRWVDTCPYFEPCVRVCIYVQVALTVTHMLLPYSDKQLPGGDCL